MGNDLPDYQFSVDVGTLEASSLVNGADAAKSAAPSVGDVYLATDTEKLYACFAAGSWTEIPATLNTVTHSEPVRALGTEYQNTGGKIRLVTVTCTLTAGAAETAQGFIGSASPPATSIGWISHSAGGGEVDSNALSFIVPPDWYYKVTAAAGTPTLEEWHEWDLH